VKVAREVVLVMNEGSEFQTDGAAHRKARFASSVLVNGTVVSSGVSDESNVRVDSRGLMLQRCFGSCKSSQSAWLSKNRLNTPG